MFIFTKIARRRHVEENSNFNVDYVFVLRVIVRKKVKYRMFRILLKEIKIRYLEMSSDRSQWLRRLRRDSAPPRLLGLRVRIPPWTWMSISCEFCVFSDRGLCVGLITRPEESY
jgi:hypothetical protein